METKETNKEKLTQKILPDVTLGDLLQYATSLCHYGGADQNFTRTFLEDLKNYPEIQKELAYYARFQEFLGEFTIQGYSIIDILVWQIDHFKSHMDRGEYDLQSNPDHMVMMAFRTFLTMMTDPEPIILAFQSETGTDYADKY